jgi:hypothetical protein
MEVDAAGNGPRAARARAERERGSAKPQSKGEASSNVDAAGNGLNAEIARQLLAIMDRELAKNATMTTPYGVTLRTIYKALCEKDAIKA